MILYVVGDNYGTSGIRKYDSNYNKVWEIVLENQDSFLYDIAYDSSNNLIIHHR